MAGYIGTGAVPQATQKRDSFTATAGQTSFATSGYSPGYVDVYMNGVRLASADFTATNGSDVVLAVAAVVGDTLEIVSFTSFEVTLGGLQAANNLSDLVDAPTAITNLGVTSTAAELNQLNAITRGSIIYGDASGATAKLAKGAAGTVLSSDGTDISWSDGPPTLTRGQIIYSNPSSTTAALAPGTAGQVLTSDGTDISWADTSGGSTFTLVASVDTTSGTAIDFTGIPSGVNRVTLNLFTVRTDQNKRLLVQLGDSGGIEATGYIASSAHTAGGQYSTDGFPISRTVASNFTSGIMILTRVTGNQWASTHSTTRDTSGTGAFGGGHKTLTGELTQLRLTRSTSGNFDQGKVSLSYE